MATRHGSATVTLPSDTEILITRCFEAPRTLIWDALTTPRHLLRWWGPDFCPLVACSIDLCPGGAWRYLARDAEGNELAWRGVYQEIDIPKRMVSTEVFEGFPEAESLNTMTLIEHDGVTTLRTLVKHASQEFRDGHVQSGMEGGMQLTFNRLEDLLALADTPAERFRRVGGRFSDRVNEVSSEKWSNPAPCAGWIAGVWQSGGERHLVVHARGRGASCPTQRNAGARGEIASTGIEACGFRHAGPPLAPHEGQVALPAPGGDDHGRGHPGTFKACTQVAHPHTAHGTVFTDKTRRFRVPAELDVGFGKRCPHHWHHDVQCGTVRKMETGHGVFWGVQDEAPADAEAGQPVMHFRQGGLHVTMHPLRVRVFAPGQQVPLCNPGTVFVTLLCLQRRANERKAAGLDRVATAHGVRVDDEDAASRGAGFQRGRQAGDAAADDDDVRIRQRTRTGGQSSDECQAAEQIRAHAA